MTGSIHVPDLI